MIDYFAYAPLLLKGTGVTLALAFSSLALATLLGGLGATAKIRGKTAAKFVQIYTVVLRGIPDLVLILLIYFGFQKILNSITQTFGWEYVELSKFAAGVAAIGIIYGAYLTETFRGAYQSIPVGQTEAAHALGMRGFTLVRKVILPQLMRFALSGYSNVWQVLIKSTAVVSIIGLEDLVGLGGDVGKSLRQPFVFYFIILLIYLLITYVSNHVFARAEKHYAKGQTG